MVINPKSHQGLTGYYMGQYDGSGQLVRKTSYIMTANSASTGHGQEGLVPSRRPHSQAAAVDED